MRTESIDIKKILIRDNSRSELRDKDVSHLMESIKEYGLLQNIIVREEKKNKYTLIAGHRRTFACTKLGRKKIGAIVLEKDESGNDMVLNLVENIQRKDINVYELGKYISILKEEFGMSDSEVAARLSVPKGRVKVALNSFHKTPPKYRSKIKTMTHADSRNKKGKIASTVASYICNMNRKYPIKNADTEKLFELAATDDRFNLSSLEIIMSLLDQGLSFKKALKASDDIVIVKTSIPMFKKDLEKLREKFGNINRSIGSLVYNSKIAKIRNPLE